MPHPIAVLAVEGAHQQDGDINFDAPHAQDNSTSIYKLLITNMSCNK
jgi:hypothetical protein